MGVGWQFVLGVKQKLIIEVNQKLVEKNLCFLGCEKKLADQAVSMPSFFFFLYCVLNGMVSMTPKVLKIIDGLNDLHES